MDVRKASHLATNLIISRMSNADAAIAKGGFSFSPTASLLQASIDRGCVKVLPTPASLALHSKLA